MPVHGTVFASRILLTCLVLVSQTALADETSQDTGRQAGAGERPEQAQEPQHLHTGFLIRLAGGPAYLSSSAKNEADALRFSGLSSNMLFSIGGAAMENLVISADLIGVSCSRDNLVIDGTKTKGNYDMTIGALGLGVTYYFMPLNMFVSGTLGVSAMQIVYPSAETRESKAGWAIAAAVGKEWWLSSEWGIGVALQLAYFDTPRKVLDVDMTTFTGGVLLTATYN